MISSRCNRFFIFSLLAATFATSAGDAAEAGAVVLKSYGTVTVTRAGAGAEVAAIARMRIRGGDRVKTGARSWCIVEFSPGNVIRIGDETSITVEELAASGSRGGMFRGSSESDEYNIRLDVGKISPALDRLRGRPLTLQTPVAVVGVRGTSFFAQVGKGAADEDGSTTYDFDVAVFDGEVAVTDLRNQEAGATSLPAGYSLSLRNVRVPRSGFSKIASAPARPGSGGGQGGPGGAPGPKGPMAGQAEGMSGPRPGGPGPGQPGQGPQAGGAPGGGGFVQFSPNPGTMQSSRTAPPPTYQQPPPQ